MYHLEVVAEPEGITKYGLINNRPGQVDQCPSQNIAQKFLIDLFFVCRPTWKDHQVLQLCVKFLEPLVTSSV